MRFQPFNFTRLKVNRPVVPCNLAIGLAAGFVFILTAWPAAADPGVTSDRITFGQVAALEGPAADLGINMRLGLQAAFEEVNKAGGVNGRKLELQSEDDGYEPTKSIEATKKLIEIDKVFGLVGAVGTPTAAATQPIAAQAGVPFIGPFTGAEFLRAPFQPNVVNVRASYFQETEEMVERLTKDRAISKISILYQDDAFGRAGLAGVQRALSKRNMQLASEGSFERNTVAVKSAMLSIYKTKPEAVILIGAYKPCAEFIRLSRQLKFGAIFVNISFVGSNSLAKDLGELGAGVIITQVVPFPDDNSLPLVARYKAALKAMDPAAQVGFVSLEGYAVGRLLIAALEKIPAEPTRRALLDTIFSNTFDLGGFRLSFSTANNQGSNSVYLTVIQADGTFKPVTDLKNAGG
jgi:branched-chain amino acid transport system substrate-binding protein